MSKMPIFAECSKSHPQPPTVSYGNGAKLESWNAIVTGTPGLIEL